MTLPMDPNLTAALAIASLGALWLTIRLRRCCGNPDSCPHMRRGSPFLDRCLHRPDAARTCPHALPTLAMHLLREGATGYALATAARAAHDNLPGSWIVLARIHDSLGNRRAARELYRREIARDENSLAAWLALGDHFAAGGDYGVALIHYRRAAESDPSLAEAWCALGRCYAALDDWADARACYEVALRRDPGHLPTMHALGLVLVGAGDMSGALEIFTEILEIAGPSGPLLARLGRLARESGDYRRAVVYLKDAMSFSALPDLKQDMAELYATMGQSEIAEFYRQEFEREYV